MVFQKTSKYSLNGFDHIDVDTPLMMVSNEPIMAHTPSPLTPIQIAHSTPILHCLIGHVKRPKN
jgi:hypothetical protein